MFTTKKLESRTDLNGKKLVRFTVFSLKTQEILGITDWYNNPNLALKETDKIIADRIHKNSR